MSKKVGFIGLGHMGTPMAENLLKQEGSIIVYNRTASKCDRFVKEGAEAAASIAEISEKADIIFLSLSGPIQVETVVSELIANGKEGQIIVDTSTVSPKTNLDAVRAAKEKKIIYIDVPVSGGPAGAEKGTLSLMIGAEETEIESLGLKPYLKAFGSKFFYIGRRAGGTAIKLINNFMAFSAQVINGEALAMADSLGIDQDTFYDVTTQSSGNNMILKAKMNKIKTDDFQPGFALDLVMKDLELARQLCQDEQIPNYSLNIAIQAYRLAQKQGAGSQDSCAVIHSIRSQCK
jgi:3-hydroxyisobutyrate dehydrogenase-like beta-hydroxyacid dehydrogenase